MSRVRVSPIAHRAKWARQPTEHDSPFCAQFYDPRLPDYFWRRCIPEPNSGCWLWIAGTRPGGYGNITYQKRTASAHRFAYQHLVGPIPIGLELDHLCRTRSCCNPQHLEPVTHRENGLRGEGVVGNAARATHCPFGHPYDAENTYLRPDTGTRQCLKCTRSRALARSRGIAWEPPP